MSNLQQQQNKLIASMASIQTILEHYPVLMKLSLDDWNLSLNPMAFIVYLCGLNGITEKDLLDKLARLIGGNNKTGEGFLNVIEKTIKVLLETNIAQLLDCNINPLLPNQLMYQYTGDTGQIESGKGIEIDLDKIDMTGTLNFCPTSDNGKNFYFDAKSTIYPDLEEYSNNELWRSMDFDAFLWYVINKGNIFNETERQHCYWDNRVTHLKEFINNTEKRNEFFNATGSTAMKECDKKQIVLCEFVERNTSNANTPSNVLKIYLNNEEYHNKYSTPKGLGINKTIFEFNHDFIWSLKLFDPKTLVTQIIHSLIGYASTFTVDMNVNLKQNQAQQEIRKAIENIVKESIVTEEQKHDDYFAFSNNESEEMLRKSTQRYNGIYQDGEMAYPMPDSNEINEVISDIDNAATLVEQEEKISNALEKVAEIMSPEDDKAKQNYFGLTFKLNADIITSFINQVCVELIMSLFSPKLVLLYAINGEVMGGEYKEMFDVGKWKDFKSKEKWVALLRNLITTIVKELYKIVLQFFYDYLIEWIKPILEKLVYKLLMEKIKIYKDIIMNLLGIMTKIVASSAGKNIYSIDNVNYADIIPLETQQKP